MASHKGESKDGFSEATEDAVEKAGLKGKLIRVTSFTGHVSDNPGKINYMVEVEEIS